MQTSELAQTEYPSKTLLGVKVSLLNLEETLHFIDKLITSGESHMVVTADASGFADCENDPELQEIYESASLVTPDSQGVIWALGRKGAKGLHRVSGVEIVDRLCNLSANKGYRIFILGSAPGVAETAAEKLRLKHPGCNIVGTRHGHFPAEDDQLIAAEVAEYKPNILFVALGIPRQEKFIFRTMDTIRAGVSIGVGGSFDVYSGKTKRAPVLIQKMKCEWIWRLLLNPSKFGKVKKLPVFMKRVLRDRS